MSINSVLLSGAQGVQAGIGRANQAAGQIARSGPNFGSGDLALPILDLQIGEIQVKASASAIKAGDQLLGTLLDIKG
jgi:hypothetical protein